MSDLHPTKESGIAVDPFTDDVLERLAQSNQHYQRTHGHYIVPLAERLLDARILLRNAEQGRVAAQAEAFKRGDERDALREALYRYGHHDHYCQPDVLDTASCVCGFNTTYWKLCPE